MVKLAIRIRTGNSGTDREICPRPYAHSTSAAVAREHGRVELGGVEKLDEINGYEYTAYNFSKEKKWWILTVVALCQTSMNFNAAIYSNAVHPLNKHYGISTARNGMAAFLITYAFGCELWAPWSEEFGRWIIMQLSLFFINVWQPLAGASRNWNMVLASRVLGGFSTAGGSVTLGMVADMFDPDEQSHAVLFAAFWSCLGSVIGGICGGPVEEYLDWRWNFWIQLIFGLIVQAVHFFTVPETRSTVMLDRKAKKMTKARRADRAASAGQRPSAISPDSGSNQFDLLGPSGGRSIRERLSWQEIGKTMWRPYHMLIFEPIVLCLSLLSGFSDALIFSFLESYGIVFGQWHFNAVQFSLAMFALLIGYCVAYFSFFPVISRQNKVRKQHPDVLTPESRLWWLLFLAPLLPIGLFGSAFVVAGPPLPWIAPLIFAVLIGTANMAVYYATIDYMVAAYGGKYAASATGGNGFARDLLAGLCAFYTGPMYKALGTRTPTFLLFTVSCLVCIPVYVFYWKGHWFRERSRWAAKVKVEQEKIARVRDEIKARRQQVEA
ncbi:MFS general substrate transporter [Bimuria novae-zelandiae CBS 107.79]|uniref:MFS general substrate transporter n=1 Tax=Bimuria novae-zelandiae CBS 107.79 TaxID=1447943 RepID=A0A6A5V7E0_9PLEO|nr:MFS general substrate transporter [Bimuria novae-zelandiae CBS 107.79]